MCHSVEVTDEAAICVVVSFAIWDPPISEKDLSFEEIDAKLARYV